MIFERLYMSDTVGYVSHVSEQKIEGTCNKKSSGDASVVTLYLDGVKVRSRRADILCDDEKSGKFKFLIGESLLNLLPEKALVEVKTEGKSLSFQLKVNDFIKGNSVEVNLLEKTFQKGWCVDHWGNLQVPFSVAPERIPQLLDFYTELKNLLKKEENLDLLITGGNLLGILRSGKFLDHDDDLDTTFWFRANDINDVSRIFFEYYDRVKKLLVNEGYQVSLVNVCHFHVVKNNKLWVDVLVGWVDENYNWYRPSGYGGCLNVDSLVVKQFDYLGCNLNIPAHANREMEITYGKNWMTPDEYYTKDRDLNIIEKFNKLNHLSKSMLTDRRS